ncbi:MAG: atpH [Gemmataceae bacterium]|nr:atpH [Gemmataceae bacterium]
MPEAPEVGHESVLTANVRQARIARVYAEAILAVAARDGQEDAVGAELDAFVTDVLGKDPKVAAFFTSPAVSRRTREPILAAALTNTASPLLGKFLRVLNRNNRLDLLKQVAAAYRNLQDRRAGRVRVVVRSAVPLSADQQQDLRRTLAASLHKEPVLDLRTDPDLLGGLVVQVGDKVYDSSVRTRLAALRIQLTARGTNVVKA